MSECPHISHPLGLDGPWTCVPTQQREVEERLLEAVMLSLEADEEFRTSPRGSGIEDMDARKIARKKSFDLQTKMQARMVEYREYRLLNGPGASNEISETGKRNDGVEPCGHHAEIKKVDEATAEMTR